MRRYESPTTGQDDKECVDAVSTTARDAAIADWKLVTISRDRLESRILGLASGGSIFLEDFTRSRFEGGTLRGLWNNKQVKL